MEIICKNCNTSHYLSDDKISLETKIGKCKQCSAPITVLGENATVSIEPTPPEQEATKNCNFCGEIILAIAKKCRHCGSILDGSNVSESHGVAEQNIPPSTENHTAASNWFYEKNGQQQGSAAHYPQVCYLLKINVLPYNLLHSDINIDISHSIKT